MPKWTPATGRRRVRAHRNSSADQAVLRPGQRHQRSAARAGIRQRSDRQSQSVGGRVFERGIRGGRRAAVARHHRRSDRRAEDRPGHPAPLTRADHRRAQPELRRRAELLLSRHDFVAGAARAAAHAEQPAGRVRAVVRRRQHGGSTKGAPRSIDQPARFGGGRGVGASTEAAGIRPQPARPVPDRRPRNRTAGAEGRPAVVGRPADSQRRRPACRATSKSTSS